MDTREAVLTIDDVTFSHGNDFILQVPHMTVYKGEFVCVMGLNGSGKTTLLHLIAHTLRAKHGAICIDGESSSRMSPRHIAQHIAVVEQEVNYVFPYTVLEIVLMGRFAYQQGRFFETDEDIEKALSAMQKTGIAHYRDRLITSLSGGERRRVEIARALAQETDIILLDEPTAFLDIKQQEIFMTLLQELNQVEGKTIVCVTHRLDIARMYGDRAVILKDGRIAHTLDLSAIDDEAVIAEKILSVSP